jgi:hypothetical protein
MRGKSGWPTPMINACQHLEHQAFSHFLGRSIDVYRPLPARI